MNKQKSKLDTISLSHSEAASLLRMFAKSKNRFLFKGGFPNKAKIIKASEITSFRTTIRTWHVNETVEISESPVHRLSNIQPQSQFERRKNIIPETYKEVTVRYFVPNTGKEITCPECGGFGKVSCTMCHGRGYNQCYLCDGTGKVIKREACPACSGSGRLETKTVYRRNRYNSYEENDVEMIKEQICPNCNGVGYFDYIAVCDNCGGNGRTGCYRCESTGVVTCGKCDGTSSLIRVKISSIKWTPRSKVKIQLQVPDYIKTKFIKNALGTQVTLDLIPLENGDTREVLVEKIGIKQVDYSFNDNEYRIWSINDKFFYDKYPNRFPLL